MLMWLEPGPRPRGSRRWEETWSWHREERAPFAQLFASFSHALLGLEEVSKMIWSDLFHCNDEETAQRDFSNLLKSAHKSDRAGVKICIPWVIAQLRPLRDKGVEFWTSRNVPECVREGPLLWFLLFFLIHQSDLEMAKLIYLMKEDMVCTQQVSISQPFVKWALACFLPTFWVQGCWWRIPSVWAQ